MPLTDTRIRNAKAIKKPVKLTDAKGLYVEIRPSGAKLWRYRYRIAGKENVFAAGEYTVAPPNEGAEQKERRLRAGQLTLEEARIKRSEWRGLVKRGLHPAHVRRTELAETIAQGANTFEAIAREWLNKKGARWTERNRKRIVSTLEREVFPTLGSLPIRSVTPAQILQIMTKVEAAGAPTVAILIRQWCFRIFNHAIATLRTDRNPAAGEISEAIHVPPTRNNPPLERAEIPKLLTAISGYGGRETTKVALTLLLLTFVRSAELRGATWAEFDLDRAEWRIPGARMKMRSPHIVPLSTQAIALLRALQKFTGGQKYLFPNTKTRGAYMAATTLNAALVNLGYEGRFSPHGFRATASTMLNEMGYNSDWIERQLAHKARGVRADYNKAEHLEGRRQMMQHWADVLVALGQGGKVIPLQRRA